MSITSRGKRVAQRVLPPVMVDGARLLRTLAKASYPRVRSNGGLTDQAILEQAKRHLDEAIDLSEDSSQPASRKWTAQRKEMRESVAGITTLKEAIQFGQSRMGFDHRRLAADITSFKPFAFSLGREFPDLIHLVDKMDESRFSHPATTQEYRGHLVSNVHYFHLRYLLFCLTQVGRPEVVCEIGGGYGGPARLWMDNPVHVPKQYLIVDFPESLFLAEVFLRANFPDADVHYVISSAPVEPQAT